MVILGVVMPLFAFVVPFLGLPEYVKAFVVGFLVVGAPDLCFVLGAILAGKKGVDLVKSKIFKPAGEFRYYVGLSVLVICVCFNWVLAYLVASGIISLKHLHWLYILAGGDILAFSGVFMMGPEFYRKVKDLFVWHGMSDGDGNY